MKKPTINFVVDLVSLLVMFGMIATGLLIRYILPPGSGHAGKVVWGLGRHDWGDVHFWLSVAILALLLVHVALHWAWVCTIVRRLLTAGRAEGKKISTTVRNLYGLGFLAVLVALFAAFLWIASTSVATVPVAEDSDHPPRRGLGRGTQLVAPTTKPAQPTSLPHEQNHEDHDGIRGYMTLAEVEAATGVPASVLKAKLGLPENVSPEERLGRLKRQHGFELSAVRKIVEDYKKSNATPNNKP